MEINLIIATQGSWRSSLNATDAANLTATDFGRLVIYCKQNSNEINRTHVPLFLWSTSGQTNPIPQTETNSFSEKERNLCGADRRVAWIYREFSPVPVFRYLILDSVVRNLSPIRNPQFDLIYGCFLVHMFDEIIPNALTVNIFHLRVGFR